MPVGEYVGRVKLAAANGLAVPAVPYLEVHFEVVEVVDPRMTVVNPDKPLKLGPVSLVQPGEGQVQVQFNDPAKRLEPPPKVHVRLEFEDAPAGLAFEIGRRGGQFIPLVGTALDSNDPPRYYVGDVEVLDQAPLCIRTRVTGANARPRLLLGKLQLSSATAGVQLAPRNVTDVPVELQLTKHSVRLKQNQFLVDVKGYEELPALPVSCWPDSLLGDQPVTMVFEHPKGTQPEMPKLDLEPTDFAASSKQPEFNLHLRMLSEERRPGKWEYTIPIHASDPMIGLEPSGISLIVNNEPLRPQFDCTQYTVDLNLDEPIPEQTLSFQPESLSRERPMKFVLGPPRAIQADALRCCWRNPNSRSFAKRL